MSAGHNALPIELLNPKTFEVQFTFSSIAEARKWTGLSASSYYARLKVPYTKQKPVRVKSGPYIGSYVISYADKPNVVVKADPDALYIVTDGKEVYHKGTLKECKDMKEQLGFPTLTIKLWQQNN